MGAKGFIITAFSLIASPGLPAQLVDELAMERAHLIAAHQKLGNHLVQYEEFLNNRLVGRVEFGRHSESGWGFSRTLTIDDNGNLQARQEQWICPDGRFIQKAEEDMFLFEGASAAWRDYRKMAALLHGREGSESPIQPYGFLFTSETPRTFSMINSGGLPNERPWIEGCQLFYDRHENESLLIHPVWGRLTMDRETGLVKQQAINRPEGVSRLVLSSLQKEPAADDFARRLDLPLSDLTAAPYRESPHARTQHFLLLQSLMGADCEAKWPTPDLLEDHLMLQEQAFVGFLSHSMPWGEMDENHPKVRRVVHLAVSHAKVTNDHPVAVMQHPAFKRRLLKEFAKTLRQSLAGQPNADMLQKIIGTPVQGRPDQSKRLEVVEEFIIRSHLRASLEVATDFVLKKMRE